MTFRATTQPPLALSQLPDTKYSQKIIYPLQSVPSCSGGGIGRRTILRG